MRNPPAYKFAGFRFVVEARLGRIPYTEVGRCACGRYKKSSRHRCVVCVRGATGTAPACPVCAGPLNRCSTTAHYCWSCFRAVHRLRAKAMRVVARAVRRGELAPATQHGCADCGASAFGYDHRDYFQPLEVAPVCRPCNHARGSAFPLTPGAIAHVDLAALEAAA